MDITIDALRELVNDRAKQNPQAYTRLSRAAHIIVMFDISPHPNGGFIVPSETGPGEYRTDASSCECADAKAYTCKHQLAVQLLAELRSRQRQTAPTARPQPQQRTRAPEPANPFDRYTDPDAPGPRDPNVCPEHGHAKVGRWGLYCPTKVGAGFCRWSVRQAA